MTPEEQRIAIAEACGWLKIREHWEKNNVCAFLNGSIHHRQLPDYLNDLNAMHKAEQTLTDDQYTAYEDCMWSLMDPSWRDTPTVGGTTIKMPASRSRLSSATAAQRAEAFLKTIGKWVE